MAVIEDPKSAALDTFNGIVGIVSNPDAFVDALAEPYKSRIAAGDRAGAAGYLAAQVIAGIAPIKSARSGNSPNENPFSGIHATPKGNEFRGIDPNEFADLASLSNKRVGEIGEHATRNLLKDNGFTDILPIRNASDNGFDFVARDPRTNEFGVFEVKTTRGLNGNKPPNLSKQQKDPNFVLNRLGDITRSIDEGGAVLNNQRLPDDVIAKAREVQQSLSQQPLVRSTAVGVNLNTKHIGVSPFPQNTPDAPPRE